MCAGSLLPQKWTRFGRPAVPHAGRERPSVGNLVELAVLALETGAGAEGLLLLSDVGSLVCGGDTARLLRDISIQQFCGATVVVTALLRDADDPGDTKVESQVDSGSSGGGCRSSSWLPVR
jgi:hypothetical protein